MKISRNEFENKQAAQLFSVELREKIAKTDERGRIGALRMIPNVNC
jgi:hypothetical protein